MLVPYTKFVIVMFERGTVVKNEFLVVVLEWVLVFLLIVVTK